MNAKHIEITGSGKNWRFAYVKDRDLAGRQIRNINELESSGFALYDASTPGNLELDLLNAGVLPEPFFGTNMVKVHELEDCHVFYYTRFLAPQQEGMDSFLEFQGLDNYADIFVDGDLLGQTDNMLIYHQFPICLEAGEHELFIHIRPACLDARKYQQKPFDFSLPYNRESLYTRKAPHMYGWDICPRAVSAGIWKPIYLIYKNKTRIEEFSLNTLKLSSSGANLSAFFCIKSEDGLLRGYSITIDGVLGDSSFHHTITPRFTTGSDRFFAGDIKTWWPLGRGGANLYDVTVTLSKDGLVLDTMNMRLGIRTISLDRTGTTDEMGAGEFCFIVNGLKTFIFGSNWVPLDAFHSRDKERIAPALELAKEAGINMLRLWGGNVYEDDLFYDLCDEYGIMLWQDFSMACALYPQDTEFQGRIKTEAESVIKRLRNHASLALWSGDNECDFGYMYWAGLKHNPNDNVLTRVVLTEALRLNDPFRDYLPSSPYIDSEAYEKGEKYLPENHLWGPRDYYKSNFYAGSLCHFASEIGYHGCPSVSSMEKFISKDKLWPYENNEEWLIHASQPILDFNGSYAYRIDLMAKQINEMFGFTPGSLEEFALASQISQAEAKKFFIELFRQTKWRRTGIIWWNLLDCWPQFSDAVVDYYFAKKLAYHYIKRAHQRLLIAVCEPKDWKCDVIASNDTLKGLSFKYRLYDIDTGDTLLAGSSQIPADGIISLGQIPFSHGKKEFIMIEWESEMGCGKNHYLAGFPPFDFAQYKIWMEKAGYGGEYTN